MKSPLSERDMPDVFVQRPGIQGGRAATSRLHSTGSPTATYWHATRLATEDPAHRIILSGSEWLDYVKSPPARFEVVSGGVILGIWARRAWHKPGRWPDGGRSTVLLRDVMSAGHVAYMNDDSQTELIR